jgi:hypothetical protein
MVSVLWRWNDGLCALLAFLLRTAGPITKDHTRKCTSAAQSERETHGQRSAVGHSGAFLTLRTLAWWERGEGVSMTGMRLSHLQRQHSSSSERA